MTSEVQTVGICDNIESLDKQRIKKERIFLLSDEEFDALHSDGTTFNLVLSTNIEQDLTISVWIDNIVPPKWYGIVTGSIILFLLYFFIIFDILHRTFAAMIASSLSIAALSYVGKRPTMIEIVNCIEAETLLLLFSMMIIVAIIAKTGLFDYSAVFAYKVSELIFLCVKIIKQKKVLHRLLAEEYGLLSTIFACLRDFCQCFWTM